MTEEQINKAIATALGLEIERRTRRGNPDPNGVQLWCLIEHHGGVATWRRLANYCNDLNAMHDAEKVLTSMQQDEYWDHLSDEEVDHLFATARQRAEAFLRTLGKWEE